MKFQFNRDAGRIESDDPEIFVEVAGATQFGPIEFVLHWHGKKLGFGLAGARRSESAPEVTIWFVDSLCQKIKRTRLLPCSSDSRLVLLTNCYAFVDEDEQNAALSLIEAALSAYGGGTASSNRKSGKAIFTDSLKRRLSSKDFIKS